MFTVYTYFGRVVSRHHIQDTNTHHKALAEARLSLLAFEKETGQPAWMKSK